MLDLDNYHRVVEKTYCGGGKKIAILVAHYGEYILFDETADDNVKLSMRDFNRYLDYIALVARHKKIVDRFLKREKTEYGNHTRKLTLEL